MANIAQRMTTRDHRQIAFKMFHLCFVEVWTSFSNTTMYLKSFLIILLIICSFPYWDILQNSKKGNFYFIVEAPNRQPLQYKNGCVEIYIQVKSQLLWYEIYPDNSLSMLYVSAFIALNLLQFLIRSSETLNYELNLYWRENS